MAQLRRRVRAGCLAELFDRPEHSTLDALSATGFSPVSQLPANTVRLEAKVATVDAGRLTLASGETLAARAVVVATEGPEAERLFPTCPSPGSRSVTCLYFAADTPPIAEPILLLDGDGHGPVNNLCVPSVVAPTYASPGAALISATVLQPPPHEETSLEVAVRAQLSQWFGPAVQRWRHLRTSRISHALPEQSPPAQTLSPRPVRLRPGLYVCGDHRETASIHGAMVSGRRAAEAVITDLRA